ncbi:MAG: diguanylate cyclase domain-containing protein [Halanaerobium sp.]
MLKLLKNLKYLVIIILASVMVFIFYNQYTSTKEVVIEKFQSRQQLVEKNILQTVNYINDSYKVVEQELNSEMKEYSQLMVDKYTDNPDVEEWDLKELKADFKYYDIYVIDKELKVIKTSKESDLGLDFSEFGSFAGIVRKRLEGDSFEVDRIDLATQTGEVKKYSYMPTPDNEYLLELSISVEDKYPSFKHLNMFKDAGELTEEYDIVEEIAFYSVEPINYGVAKLRSSKKPYLDPDVPELQEELARQAVLTGEMQAADLEDDSLNHSFKFFPVLISNEENSQGWNSYVVGITYNDQVIRDELNRHRYLFSINILLLIIFFIAFIGVVIYLLNKFEYQANHDKLTGLANRKLFVEEFAQIKAAADKTDSMAAVVFVDIDKFKEINDNFGHDFGDRVLEKIAGRMKNSLKKNDRLARMGGDEFAIALTKISSQEEAVKITQRLIDNFKEPLVIAGTEIEVNLSAGISFYSKDGTQLEELIKNADYAMYQAKRKDKDLEIN